MHLGSTTDTHRGDPSSSGYGTPTDRIREEILVGKASGFVIHKDGTIRFYNRVCVPTVEALQKKILNKGHSTPHSVHLGENKLYKDLKRPFW